MESSSIEIQESDLENLWKFGSFGSVHRVKNCKLPTVLKYIHDRHDDPQGIHDRECMALKELNHEHIVKYYGIGSFCPKGENVIRFGILMEDCEKGSLKDWLYNPIMIYEMSTVVWWSQQMMSALEYLHEKKTVHRDIKPANILVTENFILKLGDFGLTRLNHHTTAGPTYVGTPRYMSPELWTDTIVDKRVISSRSDVYSLGLVMWEMIERRMIPNHITLYQSISDGAKSLCDFEPLTCGHEIRNIIEKCTVFDYEKRPDASEMLQEIIKKCTVFDFNTRPYASEMLQEILEICKRLRGPAAMPLIDNNQTRVIKPRGLLDKIQIEIQKSNLDYLGGGSFGVVYRYNNFQPPTVLKLSRDQHDGLSPLLEKECVALKDLDHDHIVKYYGIGKVFQEESGLYQSGILMEYCAKKSLAQWLDNPIMIYQMNTVVWWSQQMMSALEYLEGKKTVHRDIKPENILVTENFVLKLGNFGSTRLDHHTTSGPSMAGTKQYLSPELWSEKINNEKISTRSDVYSLGLVMWEMIERRKIFSDPEIFRAYSINDGSKALCDFEPLTCGHEIRNIIEKCTVFDYEKRPDASEMLQEIVEISKRLGGLAAMPRIDNNQTRVLKPTESIDECRIVGILSKHLGKVYICSWSPKEDVLATGSWDNTARIWDLQDCEDMKNPDSKYKNRFMFRHSLVGSDVWMLDWHRSGDQIATGCEDGVVRIWDITSGDLHSTLDGHKGYIWALRWNPTGDLLLSADDNGSTIVWEQPIKTRFSKYQKKQQFDFHARSVWDVDWISNDTFTSCSEDETIKVCRVGSDRPIRTYTGHMGEVNAVRYDFFSKRLASCSDDKSIKIWSLSEDEAVHTFKQHRKVVNTVRWSPQGAILASASKDTTVRVWDGNEGKEVAVLDGHTGNVDSFAFSPNGQFIASGSWDQSVFVWDVKTSQPVSSWKGNNEVGAICDVAFNRTGEKLAACTEHAAVIIMDIRFLKRGHDDSIHPLHRIDTST